METLRDPIGQQCQLKIKLLLFLVADARTYTAGAVFAAAADILSYLLGKATLLYGVLISTMFLLGWIITVLLWINCQYWTRDVESSGCTLLQLFHVCSFGNA